MAESPRITGPSWHGLTSDKQPEPPYGRVFDVQRTSFADGPGIRTTVFFKGCNLRCWCHNPESQSPETQLLIAENVCCNCGACRTVCPHRLKTCDQCGRCTLYCPTQARRLCGRTVSAGELLAEIGKDKAFYDNSGGGVTFSGGECLLQADFLCELLKRCKAAGIHTAVDTAGNVSWKSFESVLPFTDLFLYDIKALTPALHREGTGVSNKRILENLRHLSGRANLIVRIPVIGGFNDSETEMRAIAAFLHTIDTTAVELLPYHTAGVHKYAELGRACPPFTVPTAAQMAHFRSLFSA